MNEDTWGLDDFVPMEVKPNLYNFRKSQVNYKTNLVHFDPSKSQVYTGFILRCICRALTLMF